MRSNQKGFTLIEVAMVLLIVGLLVGTSLSLFGAMREQSQYRQARAQMHQIMDQLIAFAQANGRLPCPDGVKGDGVEDSDDKINNETGKGVDGGDGFIDGCTTYVGRVPIATLGLMGSRNEEGNLLDPWNQPYIYQVSAVDTSGAPGADLVSPNGIRAEGMTAFNQLIVKFKAGATNNRFISICNRRSKKGIDSNCESGEATIFRTAVAVIVSRGRNFEERSSVETENTDNDRAYVDKSRDESGADAYDDIVLWLSPTYLISKMIAADQLP